MQLEPFICNLDPDTKTVLKMYLFENVQNIEEIRNNVVKGNWQCAVVKAHYVMDPLQVAVAVNKAVVAHMHGNLLTKTVYSEIVYNLCIAKSISLSLNMFGIQNDKDILVCFLVTPGNDNSKEILDQIDGKECPISDLSKLSNLKEIKSIYKVADLDCDSNLLNVIVSRIATKQITSYY